jgi:hypothetical protein
MGDIDTSAVSFSFLSSNEKAPGTFAFYLAAKCERHGQATD